MNKWILAGCMLAAGIGIAQAESDCKSEIEKTIEEWRALQLVPGSKPSSLAKGVGHHEHPAAAVNSMRIHLVMAKDLCQEGKDHEAILHLDVIRAYLHLPEFQHPTSHHYLYKEK